MKIKNKNILMAILLLVFAFITLVCLSISGGFSDRKIAKFSDKHQAVEYIEKGWIPSDIPENAKNIILCYDIDTNVINGSFQSTQKYISKFKETLYRVEKEEFGHKKRIICSKFENITKSFLNKDVSFYKNERYLFAIDEDSIYFFSLHP